MTNLLQKFEQDQVIKLAKGTPIPDFQAGDTVRVNVRIVEGRNERIQAFEGLCIARKNKGLNSAFTVRKISHGEGVERVFSLHSPRVESIEVVRRGVVRRAKLYYMRELTGKAARIKEKRNFNNEGKSKKAKATKAEESAPKTEKKKEAPKAKAKKEAPKKETTEKATSKPEEKKSEATKKDDK